jgi:hypothetical protein
MEKLDFQQVLCEFGRGNCENCKKMEEKRAKLRPQVTIFAEKGFGM